jgi:hypothetical protein
MTKKINNLIYDYEGNKLEMKIIKTEDFPSEYNKIKYWIKKPSE